MDGLSGQLPVIPLMAKLPTATPARGVARGVMSVDAQLIGGGTAPDTRGSADDSLFADKLADIFASLDVTVDADRNFTEIQGPLRRPDMKGGGETVEELVLSLALQGHDLRGTNLPPSGSGLPVVNGAEPGHDRILSGARLNEMVMESARRPFQLTPVDDLAAKNDALALLPRGPNTAASGEPQPHAMLKASMPDPGLISGQAGQPLAAPSPRQAREPVQPLPVLQNATAATVVQENLKGHVLDNVAEASGRGEQVLTSLVNSASAVEGPVSQTSANAGANTSAAMSMSSGVPVTASLEPLPFASQAGGPDKPVTGAMQTPLGEPGWEAELEARVRWLIERGNSQAELRLNPPHLGSLLVNISEDSDGTKIVFVTQNPQARELLENTLMKLQEMLQDGGVRLADTGVSDQPYTQQQGAERQDPLSLDQPYESVLDQPQDREGYVGPASRGTSAIDLYA